MELSKMDSDANGKKIGMNRGGQWGREIIPEAQEMDKKWAKIIGKARERTIDKQTGGNQHRSSFRT